MSNPALEALRRAVNRSISEGNPVFVNQPFHPKMKEVFPDFDQTTLPAIPANWKDSSWKNEPCPSFTIGDVVGDFLQVFIDYADTDKREHAESGRFTVVKVNTNGEADTLYHGDNWQEVERVTLGAEYADLIGYNPFEDEPTISVETVRNTIAEFRAELAANLRTYRVWTRYQKPEDGCDRKAESSFEARKAHAAVCGVDVTDIMARWVEIN